MLSEARRVEFMIDDVIRPPLIGKLLPEQGILVDDVWHKWMVTSFVMKGSRFLGGGLERRRHKFHQHQPNQRWRLPRYVGHGLRLTKFIIYSLLLPSITSSPSLKSSTASALNQPTTSDLIIKRKRLRAAKMFCSEFANFVLALDSDVCFPRYFVSSPESPPVSVFRSFCAHQQRTNRGFSAWLVGHTRQSAIDSLRWKILNPYLDL